MLHHQTGALRPLRRDQQMDMVGHQAIGVNPAAILPGLLSRMLQIATVIRLRRETGRPVITALDDMPGDTRYCQACASWHYDFHVQVKQAATTAYYLQDGKFSQTRTRKSWSVPCCPPAVIFCSGLEYVSPWRVAENFTTCIGGAHGGRRRSPGRTAGQPVLPGGPPGTVTARCLFVPEVGVHV